MSTPNSEDLIVSAWRGHAPFADWLVRELEPEVIVDLGVDFGISSFTFAKPGIGMVYGIDSFEGDPEAGFRNTLEVVRGRQQLLGIKNLELIQGYFSEVAKTWDKPIDILHIDGRHRYEDVKEDFETWFPFVRDGGVALMHDTVVETEPFGVKRFFAELKLPKTNFTHSSGLGIVSTDPALIRRIESRHKLWLVSQPSWQLVQRIGRKLKRTLVGEKRPDF